MARDSAHFQGCQALEALSSSCSPHALAGTYTLALQARQDACGRDPAHVLFPCPTPRSTRVDLMSDPAGFGREADPGGSAPDTLATA